MVAELSPAGIGHPGRGSALVVCSALAGAVDLTDHPGA